MSTRFGKIGSLASLGLLTAFLGISFNQPASYAQAGRYLLNNDCINEDGDFRTGTRDISINREIYTRLFRLRPYRYQDPGILTCRLTPTTNSQSLELQFGMDSNASTMGLDVKVWVNGNEVRRERIAPGEVKTLLVDVSGARSIALETSCFRDDRCGTAGIDFFAAHLR